MVPLARVTHRRHLAVVVVDPRTRAMSDAWTTKLAATRRLLDELRVDVASSSREGDANTNHQRHDAERARATALARRKLNRLDDLLDILEDCASDGDASEEETRAREAQVREFRKEARWLRGASAAATKAARDVDAGAGANGGATDVGANVRRVGEAIGRGVSDAAASVSQAAGGLVASATSKASDSAAAIELAATTMVMPERAESQRQRAMTKAMDTRELIDHQTTQMKNQDAALEGLDSLVGNLRVTSEAIHEEVKLQAKLVEDLEADFSHTSDRMRKLRKQGFKLAGEKNEEAREKIDREEALAEMREKLKLKSKTQEDSSCVVQ